MSDTAVLLCVAYGVGYALWLAYSMARVGALDESGIQAAMAFVALLWPAVVLVYVSYRIFR